MKCPLCGFEFKEEEAERACKNCPFFKGCQLRKCPNCAYEMLPEPKLVKMIKKWRTNKNAKKEI